MRKLPFSSASLVLLSGILLSTTVACSSLNPTDSSTGGVPTPQSSIDPAPGVSSTSPRTTPNTTAANLSSQADTYQQAIIKASSAQNLSQSAQSPDDWQLVANRWQQATDLLKAVPVSSPNYKFVKTKLGEYQRQLAYAQKQTNPAIVKARIDPTSVGTTNDESASGVGVISTAHMCNYLERLLEEAKQNYAQNPTLSTSQELNRVSSAYYRDCAYR